MDLFHSQPRKHLFSQKKIMKHLRILLMSAVVLGSAVLNAQSTKNKPAPKPKEIMPAVQIYFETGKAVIKGPEIQKLNQLLDTLAVKDEFRLVLTGHTDSTGDDQANLRLSKGRVDNVFSFLMENGIDTTWMAKAYFGRSKPREGETSAEKKARNRRVEITIYEKPKPKPLPKPVAKDTCTRDTTVLVGNGLYLTLNICDLKKMCPRGAENCVRIKKYTSMEDIINSGAPLKTAKGEGFNWAGVYEVRMPGDTCAKVPMNISFNLDGPTYKKAKLMVFTKDGESSLKPDKQKKLNVTRGKDKIKVSFPATCNGTVYVCGTAGKTKQSIILDKTRSAEELYVTSQSTMAIIPATKIKTGKWVVNYGKIEDPMITIKTNAGDLVSDVDMNAIGKTKKPGELRKKYKLRAKHFRGS